MCCVLIAKGILGEYTDCIGIISYPTLPYIYYVYIQ